MEIRIVSEAEFKSSLLSPAEKLLSFTAPLPRTDDCLALAEALEGAVDTYLEARTRLREVDNAEADHERKIRAEAQAAVDEDRPPRAIKRPDFADARMKARATSDALLKRATQARQALDAQIRRDAARQGLEDAARVPELYREALDAIQAAGAAFERLLEARDGAISQFHGSPDVAIRPLPWHGPVVDALATARQWIEDQRQPLTDFAIDTRTLSPSLAERRALAAAGEMAKLYSVELSEGWAITQYARGWKPPLIAYAGRSSMGTVEGPPEGYTEPLPDVSMFD